MLIKKLFEKSVLGFMVLMMCLGSLLGFRYEDQLISFYERRELAQKPHFSWEAYQEGKLLGQIEKYLLDQFPFREQLIRLKNQVDFYLLQKKETNGIYLFEDVILQREEELSLESLEYFIQYCTRIGETIITEEDILFVPIPSKNYYTEEGYKTFDEMYEILERELSAFVSLDLRNELELKDYYRTDIHWRQERLEKVYQRLSEKLGFIGVETYKIFGEAKENSYFPFYGSYYHQGSFPIKADELLWLDLPGMDDLTVYDPTLPKEQQEFSVYEEEQLQSIDSYNLFLGGPRPLVVIENPNGTKGEELVVIRDSFASSLIPLLLPSYEKITLIDLRYIPLEQVEKYVNIRENPNQKVMILLSSYVLNRSFMLK